MHRNARVFCWGIAALYIGGALAAADPIRPSTPQPIDVPTLKREIALRRGKVVVVNLWAKWCDGCVAEFPDLVRASKADEPKGLELITIDFDDEPEVTKSVVPFLAKNKLDEGIFVNRKGSQLDDSYPQFFEPKLSADEAYGIPRTYIYDRQGKLVKMLVGETKYADFQKAFLPILAQK